MNKTERAELKSIVRQQFRVLREEVTQRQVEVEVEAEQQIAGRYADEDAAWTEATEEAERIVSEADRKVNAIFAALPGRVHTHGPRVGWQPPRRDQAKRTDLRVLAKKQIEEKVAAAKLQLSRQEANLLRDLAMGALESDEARQFLSEIPAAGQLVPVARLAELEASLGD